MPLVRMLPEDLVVLGSPGVPDAQGTIRIPVGPGNVEKLILDYKGWLGLGETLSASAWVTDLTNSGATSTNTQASINLTIPATPVPIGMWPWPAPQGYNVQHTATSSGGRVRVTQFFLVA